MKKKEENNVEKRENENLSTSELFRKLSAHNTDLTPNKLK
jgi:hypothetical protein